LVWRNSEIFPESTLLDCSHLLLKKDTLFLAFGLPFSLFLWITRGCLILLHKIKPQEWDKMHALWILFACNNPAYNIRTYLGWTKIYVYNSLIRLILDLSLLFLLGQPLFLLFTVYAWMNRNAIGTHIKVSVHILYIYMPLPYKEKGKKTFWEGGRVIVCFLCPLLHFHKLFAEREDITTSFEVAL